MKHLTLLLLLFAAAVTPTCAQSLINTNWKTYFGDPVNDSLVLHIRTDTSFVTNRMGTAVVRSVCKISGDTLSFDDYDGEYACPSMVGRYKVSQAEGVLSFVLIDDPCDGRAGSLPATKWKKVPDTAAK